MIEFGLLGPLEVRRDGEAVRLGGPKQRLLLGMLLVEANHVVGSARLVDLLWGTEPPETASNVLQQYVSQLRRLLGPQGRPPMVVSQVPGYRLQVDPDQIDAIRFERLVGDARRAATAGDDRASLRLHDQAQSIWRGPVLADLGDEPVAVRERMRLGEVRLGALEDRMDAAMRLGRHAEVLAELEALAGEHPLRERLQGQLMLALYRAGRQADASAAFHVTRERLVDATGMEPGPALQGLLRGILRQEASLQAALAPVRLLPEDSGHTQTLCRVLIDREVEVGRLQEALASTLAGRGRLVLITGEAGIGKTRLVTELSRRAGQLGCTVLGGGCSQTALNLPYLPLVEALGNHLARVDLDRVRAHLGHACGVLADLFPVLADAAPPFQGDPGQARLRLFEAVVTLLRTESGERPLFLIVEDIHWADASTRELLEYLVRRLRDAPVLIVATYRAPEVDRQHPLQPLLADWRRGGNVDVVALKPMEPSGVGQMVRAIFKEGEVTAEFRDYLHDRCGGNPFVLEEILKEAVDRGDVFRTEHGWDRKRVADLRIPRSVSDNIMLRVERLGEDDVCALRAAAVLGPSCGYDTLGPVADLTAAQLERAVGVCVREQFLEEDSSSRDRLRFHHALTRDAVYDDITLPQRRTLHGRAADVLQAAQEVSFVEVVHHLLEAGRMADAVPGCLGAALQARRQCAPSEAARLYELAVPYIADPVQRGRVLCALGETYAQTGDARAAIRHYDAGIATLDEAEDLVESTHHRLELGRCYRESGDLDRARAEYGIALRNLEAREATADLATVYCRLAALHCFQLEMSEARALAERAITIAEAIGADAARIEAYIYLGLALGYGGQPSAGLAYLERGYAEAIDRDLHWLAHRAAINEANTYFHLLRFRDAAITLERIRRLPGEASENALAASLAIEARLQMGDVDGAHASVLRVLDVAIARGDRSAENNCRIKLIMIAIASARLDEASILERANAEIPPEWEWRSTQLLVQMKLSDARGDTARAGAAAEEVRQAMQKVDVPPDVVEAAVGGLLADGRLAEAIEVAETGRAPLHREGFEQLLNRARGRIALASGDARAAVRYLQLAADAMDADGACLEGFATSILLAEAHTALGDTQAATELLSQVIAAATRGGAHLHAQRAQRLAMDLAAEPTPPNRD